MIRVVADDRIPFLKGVLEPYTDVVYLPAEEINREALMQADALLVRTRTRCDEKLLTGTSVNFIATATIGYDHIDTEYCDRKGIRWVNAPGCNSSAVMQYLTAALLFISRREKSPLPGRTLGIIGVGNVGSKVEKAGKILGMKVLLNDPPRKRREGSRKFIPLDILLKESDIVTLHVPLIKSGMDKTFHMINRNTLDLMKKGAWLINTSRGEVAATSGLKEIIATGKLSGVILDVWEREPKIDRRLFAGTELGTPHIAGYSFDGKANGTAMIVKAFAEHFNVPLKDWYPAGVEKPEYPEIQIDCKGMTAEEVIRKAVMHTYKINYDDAELRIYPRCFETCRENYPFRREFPAYKVRLFNEIPGVAVQLKNLGFRLTRSR